MSEEKMSGVELQEFDVAELLEDAEGIFAFLNDVIEADNPALLAEALGAIARSKGVSKISEQKKSLIMNISDLKEFDAADFIKDEEDVLNYLNVVLEENDPGALAEALGTIERSGVMSTLPKDQSV